MDRHQGRGDRRRLPRQERDRERGVQAFDPALPAVVRSDEPAARRQCPVWFSRPDDLVARPGAIRAAQSSYLSPNGFAGAARGLRRHGEEDARGARRQPGVFRLCAAHTEAGLGKAEQACVRQHQDLGPLRHHPHPAGAQATERGRAEALRHGRTAIPCRVLPGCGIPADHAHHAGGRASLQNRGQSAAEPRLARGVRPRLRRGQREPAADREERESRRARSRSALQSDQAAAALHRGHATLGNGGGRQAGRGRRVARGNGSEGSGNPCDTCRDHRRADLRRLRSSRRQGAGADPEGVFAAFRAACNEHPGACLAGADRRMGAQAEADRAAQVHARGVHAAHLAARDQCRLDHQDRRHPRHRLRHGARALSEVRRRGAGKLPQVPVPEMRFLALESGLWPRMVARRSGRAHHQALHRPAHRLSQQAGQAVRGRPAAH